MNYRRVPSSSTRVGNVVSGVLLFLFSLPFAAFGLFAIYKAIDSLMNGKLKEGLFMSLFGIVFSGIGFGLMYSIYYGSRSQKRVNELKAAHPDEPWLWRKDWADGRVNSSSKSAMWFAWAFAGFWNAISSSVFTAIVTGKERHNPGMYVFLIFPLIGIGLLVWAIRFTVQWRKFGQSTFKMLSVPGVVGGELKGAIETSVKLKPEDGFHLKLVCVNRIRTGAGEDSSTTETVLWEDEKTMARELLDDDARRSGIPVYFKIPADAAESDDTNPSNRILWRLEARAQVPGVGYAAKFEVPVFRTAESASASAPAADPTLAYQAPPEQYKLPAHSRIAIRALPDGGTEFCFPAARNLGTLLYVTLMFLVWTAITLAIDRLSNSLLFEIVFTLVDVLLAFGCFSLWFKSSRVTIKAASVSVTNHWLFVGPTRKFDARDVAGFESKAGMRSGQKAFFTLQLITNGGKKTTIASYISGKREAEWLCQEFERSLPRRKEADSEAGQRRSAV